MKKEIVLLLASVTATIVLSLALIRWLAPDLLGGPRDLRLVQSDEVVPPFFEGVFRRGAGDGQDFQLPDPLTRVRNVPLYPESHGVGPHDLLGFRNRG